MIIKDALLSTIKDSLKNEVDRLRARRNGEREKYLNFFEGDTTAYIEKYFKTPTLSEIPVAGKNITKQIVQKRSLVYKKSPVRSNGENGKYNDYVADLNKKCRQLEQLTFLLGSMALLSYYDGENETMGYSVVPYFEPFFLPGAIRPFGISYPLAHYNAASLKPIRFAFWSIDTADIDEEGNAYVEPGKYFEYDLNGKTFSQTENDVNPFGILPVTFTHRSPQIDDFWVEGATDVIGANEQINILMTELVLAGRFDMLGLKYATGIDAPSDKKGNRVPVYAGTDSVFILPSDSASLGRVPGADTDKGINLLKFQVESILQDNHLKAVWVEDASQSGIALKIENLPNMEQRVATIEEIWRPFELERFEIDRIILAKNGKNIPEEYHVDFAEVDIPLTPDEIQKATDYNLKMGFTTYEQEYKQRNPDAKQSEVDEAVKAYEGKSVTSNLTKLLEEPVGL